MRILTTFITVLLLMQNTVRAEESWRFLALADWHLAEISVWARGLAATAVSELAQ